MTTLQFRVWHKPTSRMLTVYSFDPQSVYVGLTYEVQLLARDECVIMQSAGMVDSKGVEVYEGDILSTEYKDAFATGGVAIVYNEVAFRESSFGTISEHNQTDFAPFCMTELGWSFVAGNIYENPQLLIPEPEEEEANIVEDIPEELRDLLVGGYCYLTAMGKSVFQITEIKEKDLFPVGVAPFDQTETTMYVRASVITPLTTDQTLNFLQSKSVRQ